MDHLLSGVELLERLAPRLGDGAERFAARHGRAPTLAAVLDGGNEAALRQAGLKAAAAERVGMAVRVEALDPAAGTAAGLAAVHRLNADPAVDGILVQYPLPPAVDGDAAAAAMAPTKDLDVSGPAALRRFAAGGPAPAAAAAMAALLRHHRLPVAGLDAVVVGRGTPHDAPFAAVLARGGARVVTLAPADPDLMAALGRAGLVVAAVGQPGTVPAAAVPPGAIMVDAGYFNPGGRGDVDWRDAPPLRAMAPVPGGIGPMTVGVLLRRTLRAAWRGTGDVA